MVITPIDPFASGCVLSPEQGGTGMAASSAANNTVLAGTGTGVIDAKVLTAGSGISIDFSVPGQITVNSTATGGLAYQGTWNATTNTPHIANGVGVLGQYYQVATAGTTSIDGIAVWYAKDILLFNGAVWQKIDGITNEVLGDSVGRALVAVSANTLANGATGRTLTLSAGLLPDTYANYPITLQLVDAGGIIDVSDAAPGVVNIPDNATIPFVTGALVTFSQGGAGQATFTPAGGVTLNNVDGHVLSKGQFAYCTLRYRGADVWDLFGATA